MERPLFLQYFWTLSPLALQEAICCRIISVFAARCSLVVILFWMQSYPLTSTSPMCLWSTAYYQNKPGLFVYEKVILFLSNQLRLAVILSETLQSLFG